MKTPLAAALILAAFATGARAEDMMAPPTDLPPICLANAAHGTMGMGSMAMGAAPMASDQAHGDLMAGMDQMNTDMMAGATATDPDVAFVCAMIPHHRGAIAMAKAEIAHGDDEWAKTLAGQIIAAQEKEIAAFKDWHNKNGDKM